MSAKPWIVHHRDGWCALPAGAEPDPEALNDPTLCGYVVTMRGGSKRRQARLPGVPCRAERTSRSAIRPQGGKGIEHGHRDRRMAVRCLPG